MLPQMLFQQTECILGFRCQRGRQLFRPGSDLRCRYDRTSPPLGSQLLACLNRRDIYQMLGLDYPEALIEHSSLSNLGVEMIFDVCVSVARIFAQNHEVTECSCHEARTNRVTFEHG